VNRAGHVRQAAYECANPTGTTRVWQAATGQPVTALRTASATLTDAAFSPDSGSIATGSTDRVVRVYACDVCGSLDDLFASAESRLAED
jgi:WD40 repeat protein